MLPSPFHSVPVSFGAVTVDRAKLVAVSEGLFADDQTVVLTNDFVDLAVHGTHLVEIDVRPGAASQYAAAMLYGYVMRVLFLHAGVFCLHASLLRHGAGTTVAVAGHSGAGKSTTVSYAARHHRAQVLIDDVVPVTVDGGVATAHPFARPVHLFPDSAERVGLGHRPGDEPDALFAKLVVELAEGSGPVTIDHLVMLEVTPDDGTEALVVSELRGAERLRRVVRSSNSTGLSSFGRRSEPYLQWATALASSTPMTEVRRRAGADTLDDVARFITSLAPTSTGATAQPAASA